MYHIKGEEGDTHAHMAHLVVHQSRQRQVVEHIREHLPHGGVAVLPDTFVVKPVPAVTCRQNTRGI